MEFVVVNGAGESQPFTSFEAAFYLAMDLNEQDVNVGYEPNAFVVVRENGHEYKLTNIEGL